MSSQAGRGLERKRRQERQIERERDKQRDEKRGRGEAEVTVASRFSVIYMEACGRVGDIVMTEKTPPHPETIAALWLPVWPRLFFHLSPMKQPNEFNTSRTPPTAVNVIVR